MKRNTSATALRIPAGVLPLLLAFGFMSRSAHAQWHVVDEQANQQLQSIDQQLHDYLPKMYNQHAIGSYRKLPDNTPDPKQAITNPDLTDDIDHCNNLPQGQQANCQELVKTRNAQMAYMHQIYDYTSKRRQQLIDIQAERASLGSGPDSAGKLQNNTNELIALNTQIAIDRQQMESVMNSYQARIAYLNDQQARLATQALNGSSQHGGLGNIVGGLVAAVSLKTILEAEKSSEPAGMQRLSIETSNGL
jgi:hypothetical protein